MAANAVHLLLQLYCHCCCYSSCLIAVSVAALLVVVAAVVSHKRPKFYFALEKSLPQSVEKFKMVLYQTLK